MTTLTAPITSARDFRSAAGCGEEGCDAELIDDVDVYCHSHDRFLPLAGAEPRRLRPVLAFAWRAAVCLAFLLTAAVDDALPVFLAAVALGGAVVALPLRRFGALAAYALAGWVLAGGGALLLQASDRGRLQLIWTALVVATAVAWLLQFAQDALERADVGSAAALVASVFAVAPAALAVSAAAVVPGARHLVDLPTGVSNAVLVLACAAAALALLIATCGAIARTADWTLPYREGPFSRPDPPRRIATPRRRPPRRLTGAQQLPDRIGRAVLALAETVAFAAHAATVMAGNALLRAWYWCKVGFVWAVNWTWCWARAMTVIVAGAARATLAATLLATRVVLVPVAALATAGWGALQFARNTTTYLTEGSLPGLFALLGAGALTAAALHVTWIALCRLPVLPAVRSAGRTASISGANGLLMVAAGGWAIGLLGTFHHGPIRVGWVTVTTTLLLVATSVWTYVRQHRRRPVLQ
ncbi:hypothetical protein ACTMTJ_19265 [Phytohabitans sp. LJ34]|uniref:hypothetical protein n=1 Tax=Phytohabitans sp. LJ34 TaxID=3452217 RepID=UPI003F8932C2